MSQIICSAISVGLLSGIWGFISSPLGLLSWVGFVGCTSYYAAGGRKEGLKKSVICNMTGVFWAMMTIMAGNYFGTPAVSAIMTAIFTFVMCAQSKYELLSFIPATFCGSFSTFGAGGDWKVVILSLLCGAALGYFSDIGGIWLYRICHPDSQKV